MGFSWFEGEHHDSSLLDNPYIPYQFRFNLNEKKKKWNT
ncbi:hypothetical protein Pint_21840 [Pistacia integerrima]|uniref:Uncharacterized protein n=1 Tax=Pistacia integerrima TaxID=434235 RepID=A0ACC0XBA9_9ROSI|nr:hypothetical protein Pint_21840 [Pistacia integerrima]